VRVIRWLSLEYSLHQLTGILPPEKQHPTAPSSAARGSGNVLDVAQAMIARARDGEKHYELLMAARLVGGYVAGGVLSRSDAYRELCQMIDAKAGVASKTAAYKTIEDGLAMGELAPLYAEEVV
jgi:hypothetical protein